MYGTKTRCDGQHPGPSTPGYNPKHRSLQAGQRNDYVRTQLDKAQEIMQNAGVFPKSDPINQVTISAVYHMNLHTDQYILMVTNPIIALGDTATQDEIYAVLFDLRLIIAGSDPHALDY